ncbi:MAG TPA: S8 family serine peptidase [Gaiellaceae bacterium]|nr:S8 family serine peptidase [Gaiellaceae bacterium]HLG08770.1 S8 family serine peptidase [Gaiellaceae bacterium]
MRGQRYLLVSGSALAAAAFIVGTALAASGASPKRDFTEAPAAAQTQSEYLMLTFRDPPTVSYTGGTPGLERTKPERGKKLEPRSKAVRAYVTHEANAHANYRAFLRQNAPKAEIVREYSYVLNGFAIKLNGERPETLANGPGVGSAGFSWLYRPDMTVSTDLIDADVFWGSPAGRVSAGSGIKIGIIDTGIDDTHPAFDCKGPITHKLFFSGIPFGTNIFFDHGTHVSGTAAGCVIENDGDDLPPFPVAEDWSGVAPGASLTDYNVFPGRGIGFFIFGGSALSHDIADALEQAVLDGMDVVNMSLGGGVQGPHDFLADAVNAAVDAGVVAAVAAGNSGPGRGTVESPGSAAGALTAGASTNPHFAGADVDADPTDAPPPFSFGAALGDFDTVEGAGGAAFDPAITAQYALPLPPTTLPTGEVANLGCTITNDLTGKIALIDRGACTFTTKVRNAQAKGAVGVLIVNNVAGDPTAPGHDGTSPFPTIPAAMVSNTDGVAMGASGEATVDGTSPSEFITANADVIAGFSSRGPAPFTYLIKPDVTAPGVNVYSSVFEDEYAFFNGTSMATPHVAGAAALLLDSHPGWSPADVKSALVNTAKRPVFTHVPPGTAPASLLTRGGGRIDVASGASDTPLTIDPASASFGFFNGNKDVSGTIGLLVRNVTASSKTCSISESPLSTKISLSTNDFTLAAGATTTVNIVLAAGKSNSTGSGDLTGDILIDCNGTTPDLRVPWLAVINREAKP